MTEIIPTPVHPLNSALSTQHLIPLPELPIKVRLATMDDIPFIDELQKKNNKSLGFMNRPTLEGKIKREEVLIAEEVVSSQLSVASEDTGKPDFGTGGVPTVAPKSVLTTHYSPLTTKVGYLIGNDRYFKRDELGAIFQLCVVPGRRRGLVGATLLKALFERASYGCKLYCCWCAQDLEANHFWKAMGFVPVAFRSGAKKKIKRADGTREDRVHIFWQKRIRAGDTTTPWWYPHETGGGAINEDRIVLPIPPNVHWSEVKSVVVPGESEVVSSELPVVSESTGKPDAGTGGVPTVAPNSESGLTTHYSPLTTSQPKRAKKATPAVPQPVKSKLPRIGRALMFAPPAPVEVAKTASVKQAKVQAPKVKKKNDPAKVKAARYLRDRYTEEINRGDYLVSEGKYDVTRLIENAEVPTGALPVAPDQKLLAA